MFTGRDRLASSAAAPLTFQGAGAAEQAERHLVLVSADRDGESKLSLAEYKRLAVASARLQFANRDTNGDNSLSEAEFTMILIGRNDLGGQARAWVATPEDIAASGQLTDRRLALQARFRALDRNDDGIVTKGEFVPA